MIRNIIKLTHSLAIIYTLSWLSPRHAMGDYKLTCPLFSFQSFPRLRAWALPNPGGSFWLILVLRLSDFNSPSWCSLRLCTEVNGSNVISIVVAGGFISRISFGKRKSVSCQPILTGEERVCLPWFLVVRLLNTAGKSS